MKKIEDRVTYNTYDEIKVRQEKNFQQEMNTALEFIKNELGRDMCDGVKNI